MCIAGEEEPGGSAGAGGTGSVPEIVVTAPRLGLNLDVFQSIDWSEVLPATAIGAAAGYKGGWGGMLTAAAAAAATAIEAQEGVDLEDLFVIKNDMIIIPGVTGGYYPMY